MNIWERKIYKLYTRLNSRKEPKVYNCKIHFSTNPYASQDDLPKKVFDAIIDKKYFVLCKSKYSGYLYDPITLKEYSFKGTFIKSFVQYDTFSSFINKVQSIFPSNNFFFLSDRWHLESNGKIIIF